VKVFGLNLRYLHAVPTIVEEAGSTGFACAWWREALAAYSGRPSASVGLAFGQYQMMKSK
jgi:hypothetical protein